VLPQQVDTNQASIERLHTQLRLNGADQLRLLDRRDRVERQRLDGGGGARRETDVAGSRPADDAEPAASRSCGSSSPTSTRM
jgi:hypothetical protein